MNTQSTFDPQLDNLIFAYKNRDYGAYILRRNYIANVSFAMWIVILLFTLTAFGLAYLANSSGRNNVLPRSGVVEVVQLSEPPSLDIKKHLKPPDINTKFNVTKSRLTPVVKSDEFVANDVFSSADTIGLENIYSENTLNVQIKYPYGWTFVDQNVKDRLDGVTFWGSTNLYNPPPYIHLEVMDKALFNPSRFKYKSDLGSYSIFYNDPEVLSDQYSRLIYIRTETDVDYSLKLIMKGKEQFENFEPVFFGMLKTFSFGD